MASSGLGIEALPASASDRGALEGFSSIDRLHRTDRLSAKPERLLRELGRDELMPYHEDIGRGPSTPLTARHRKHRAEPASPSGVARPYGASTGTAVVSHPLDARIGRDVAPCWRAPWLGLAVERGAAAGRQHGDDGVMVAEQADDRAGGAVAEAKARAWCAACAAAGMGPRAHEAQACLST